MAQPYLISPRRPGWGPDTVVGGGLLGPITRGALGVCDRRRRTVASRRPPSQAVDIGQKSSQIGQNQPKTPKASMLKFGDVSFDFGFEW